MRLTVLMSTYNGEKFLREQLDSILAQTLPDDFSLKVIVRDDCSKDSTLEILGEYANKYPDILSYYTGDNLKPARSFWHLVCNCEQSDYYAFSDQDDVWFTDKLKRAVERLLAEPIQDIPLLYSSNVMVTDAELNPKAPLNSGMLYTDLAHVLIYNVSTGCTSVFNDLARKEFVKYDIENNKPIIHDHLADLIIAMFGKIIYDTEPSMYYRQHGDNAVGAQSTYGFKYFLMRVKRFLKSRNPYRSDCAKVLLNLYGDRLSDEQKRLIYAVAYYRTDRKARKTLKKDKAFSKGRKADFWFRWAVRLKKI